MPTDRPVQSEEPAAHPGGPAAGVRGDVAAALPFLASVRRLVEAVDTFDAVAATELGIGRSDLRALHLLEHGPASSRALADHLGLTPGGVTTLVDRLVARGYVHRRPDAADRRLTWIELEQTTYAALAGVYRRCGEAVAGTAAALPRATLLRVERAVTEAADAIRGEADALRRR